MNLDEIKARSEKAKTLGWWTMVVSIDEILAMVAEVERLKAKCNRLLDSLENEGVYQDYNDYVAEKEES